MFLVVDHFDSSQLELGLESYAMLRIMLNLSKIAHLASFALNPFICIIYQNIRIRVNIKGEKYEILQSYHEHFIKNIPHWEDMIKIITLYRLSYQFILK